MNKLMAHRSADTMYLLHLGCVFVAFVTPIDPQSKKNTRKGLLSFPSVAFFTVGGITLSSFLTRFLACGFDGITSGSGPEAFTLTCRVLLIG
jgi:hypothetical protein